MKKYLLALSLLIVIGAQVGGCNNSRKYSTAPITSDTAPTTTFNIVLIDHFTEEDRQEIIDSISIIFSGLLADYQPVVNNNINYTVNITLDKVEITINGNNILTWCGEDNECPELYEAFCRHLLGDDHPDRPRWKNRGRQLSEDCKNRGKSKGKNKDD